jgi:hypothetical protein
VECGRAQFHDLCDGRRSSLANLGIGHAAIDGGGGYTYFNPQTGHEFSAVAGFTYNFKNQDTQYQNGIDFHVDWGASQFLSKQVFRRPRGICLSAGHRRFRSESHSRRVPVACHWRRAADWISVSGWRHAGLSESERIWRIRSSQPAGGMEYVVDVLDLAHGTHQHRSADASNGDDVGDLI